ncbi:MAG: hypothetical protein DHS20C15_34850 [Planctomycetota bacterium]|nr:MAG: hypothetical protein DHS20C15_34850 [Planctomycetota bacterium]
MLLKYTELIIALIAAAWAASASSWEWEPLALLVASIAAFVYHDRKEVHGAQKNLDSEAIPPHLKADRALFLHFRNSLPSTGAIQFLKSESLAGPFEDKRLRDLRGFKNKWDNAEREFHDKELDQLRRSLLGEIQKLLGLVTASTWPVGADNEYSAVPPEWKGDLPDKYDNAISALHAAADSVVEQHQSLVRAAKHRLAV